MKKDHPSFKKPPNEDVGIWRYMPFINFVSMLEYQGLFFPRATLLGDPFEGSVPFANKVAQEVFFQRQNFQENMKRAFRQLSIFKKDSVKDYFVSCWHMGEHESVAMWDQYAKTDASIVIKSTYKKLTEVLPDYVDIGTVSYIDYKSQIIPEGNLYNFITHKRKSYEHECELRAVAWEVLSGELGGDEIRKNANQWGLWIPVNLVNLIEEVYINPTSQKWVFSLMERVVERYGLKGEIPVRLSILGEDPLW